MSIACIVENAAENDWSGVLLGQGIVLLVQASSLNYIGSTILGVVPLLPMTVHMPCVLFVLRNLQTVQRMP